MSLLLVILYGTLINKVPFIRFFLSTLFPKAQYDAIKMNRKYSLSIGQRFYCLRKRTARQIWRDK